MKITFDISKEEAQHLRTCAGFIDSCGTAYAILEKLQKRINKVYAEKRKRKEQ